MRSQHSLPGPYRAAGLALALFAACAPASKAPAYTLKTLHSFGTVMPDGNMPFGGVVMDSAGNLFGTTETGAGQDGGIVFELSPKGNRWDYKIIYNFCAQGCTGGSGEGLIIDTKGNLYGVGGGYVFELSHKHHGWEYKSLYTFCAQPECTDGRTPASALSYAGEVAGMPYDGKSALFGTTQYGGKTFNQGGVVFELTPGARSSWTYQVLYAFCQRDHCGDGSSPEDTVLVAPSGDLFGVTLFGGKDDFGTVFQLSPQGDGSWQEQVLHKFCRMKRCGNGDAPVAGLTMNAAGELFGTTIESNCIGDICPGVVFGLTPQGKKSPYSALYSFCIQPDCADGQEPFSPLILDSSGDFFGSTQFGGGNDGDGYGDGGGTVFKLSGSDLQVLYSFCALPHCADGNYPRGSLARDAAGHIFGTTSTGGEDQLGTVFELIP